jgi:hypothetical protein
LFIICTGKYVTKAEFRNAVEGMLLPHSLGWQKKGSGFRWLELKMWPMTVAGGIARSGNMVVVRWPYEDVFSIGQEISDNKSLDAYQS